MPTTLYVATLKTQTLRRLTPLDNRVYLNAIWSPDDRWITFTSNRAYAGKIDYDYSLEGTFDVFVMRSDGSDGRQVTTAGESLAASNGGSGSRG